MAVRNVVDRASKHRTRRVPRSNFSVSALLLSLQGTSDVDETIRRITSHKGASHSSAGSCAASSLCQRDGTDFASA